MNTSIKEQIQAVQGAIKEYKRILANWDAPSGKEKDRFRNEKETLNDAAATLLAINMIMSGDIGKEFSDYWNNQPFDTTVDMALNKFLASKGLKIK